MSHYSHQSRNFEFQRSENNGSRGISSTPGDQRDTGSGLMCPFKCCLKIVKSTTLDVNQTLWDVQIHCKEQIGKGGFGSVYRAQKHYQHNEEKGWKTIQDSTGKEMIEDYAIKELRYSNDVQYCQVKKVLTIENKVCDKLKILNDPHNRHENIVKPLNIISNEMSKVGYIVMEYCSGGDLARYLKDCKEERVSEAKARTIMSQITKGVHFLHSMKYIHRDIKPANVLLYKSSPDDSEYTYKLADFGLAVEFSNDSDLSTVCGTKRFMAPEMDGSRQYGPEVDIWSLGVLFFSLLIGKHAQVNATKEETYRPIKENNLKPLYPTDLQISPKTQELINSMLCNNPSRRSSLLNVESQLCYAPEANLKTYANRTADSGIASSCTSGSSSANGSWPSSSKNLFANSYERNVLPGALSSVNEEQTTIESGIDNYNYKRSVTPRNTFRFIKDDNAGPANGPIKSTFASNHQSTERSKDLPYSPIPRHQPPLYSNHLSVPTTYSTTTVDSSYRNGDVRKPAKLNTSRLRPSIKEHKMGMGKGTYCITQNLSVKIELNIEKRSNNTREPSIRVLKETLLISSDGNEVTITRNGIKQSEFLYDDLPKKYYAKYNKAAEFIKSTKAFTPKITWIHDKATCKLMENGSYSGGQILTDANFLVDFNCGIKFEYDASKGTVCVSGKTCNASKNEHSSHHRDKTKVPIGQLESLGMNYAHWCNLFRQYHEEIRQIDSLHEKLQSNNSSNIHYFPLRIGQSKLSSTSSSTVIPTSTYSHAGAYNNENENKLANQNRAHSARELQNSNFAGYNYIPSGRFSPSAPHTRSSPNV